MSKLKLAAISVLIGLSGQVSASTDGIVVKAFHKYGITKCDGLISKNTKLMPGTDWQYFLDRQTGGLEGKAVEATITVLYGSKGDTVKTVDTYIQSSKQCYLRSTWTITHPGTCASNMDGDKWYVSSKMPKNDYQTYENGKGATVQAKEISVGNFKACIREGNFRRTSNHG